MNVIPAVPKSSPELGQQKGNPPTGCPEDVVVVGVASRDAAIGDDVALTLAIGAPHLTIGGSTARIESSDPDISTIRGCLNLGEKYYGLVGTASGPRFQAVLNRV